MSINVWQERFNALLIRERLLIVVVGIAFSYALFDSVIMSSSYEKQKIYQHDIKQWGMQNKQISMQIEVITQQIREMKTPYNNSSFGSLQAQVADTEKQLENIIVKFVKPRQIAAVLRNVLEKVEGLRLMNMKSVAAIELFSADEDRTDDDLNMRQRQVAKLLQFYREREKYGLESDYDQSRADLMKQQTKENTAKTKTAKIYKHGILLELEGDYNSTLRYLKKLETLPWKFYWDAIRYEVKEYPKANVQILINTISLDEDWVRV